MNIEERNEWIVKNQEWLLRKVQSYSDKYCLDFSELYSEASVKLIYYLDQWDKERKGNPSFNDIGMRLCTHLKKYCEKQNEEKEEIPSGMEFEKIWDQELNGLEIWKTAIERRAGLTEKEIRIFCGRVFDDLTLDELRKELSLTRERIRQIYERAVKKVYKNLFSSPELKYYWKILVTIPFEKGVELYVPIAVITDHNDSNDAAAAATLKIKDLYQLDVLVEPADMKLSHIVDLRRSTLDGYENQSMAKKRKFYGIE